MNSDLVKRIVLGQLRHVLSMLATAAATQGYLADSDAQTVVGAAIAVIAAAWSAFEKKGR